MEPWQYLALAHAVLDYPLQGEFLGMGKKHYNFLLLIHCVVWAFGMCAVLEWLGVYEPWMLSWMFFGHIVMDYLKLHYLSDWCKPLPRVLHVPVRRYTAFFTKQETNTFEDPLGLPLWIDQAWHVVQVAVVLYMV